MKYVITLMLLAMVGTAHAEKIDCTTTGPGTRLHKLVGSFDFLQAQNSSGNKTGEIYTVSDKTLNQGKLQISGKVVNFNLGCAPEFCPAPEDYSLSILLNGINPNSTLKYFNEKNQQVGEDVQLTCNYLK